MSTPKKGNRRRGRAIFLEVLEHLIKAMDKGMCQLDVYRELGGQEALNMSYSQFNRYVVEYTKQGILASPKEAKNPSSTASKKEKDTGNKKDNIDTHQIQRTEAAFKYDPNAANKDDLV